MVGLWLGFDLGTDAAATEGVPTEPQSVRDQATVALGEYFAQLAASQPVVILLEDLHWADSTSMRLLDDAERMWRDCPVMVVATSRTSLLEERPRWGSGLEHHVRLSVGALSRRESRTLVLELLQKVDDPPMELVDLVVDSGEGNPFYLEELVTWLIDSGVVVPDSPRWRIVDDLVGRLVVPPSLKGLLQARLDALTSSERTALQRASVVGRIFWDDAVTHLAADGDSGDTAPFDHLLARDLVFERELSAFDSTREFLFKHALLRDVAYDSVLRARRREYHRRAARWLADVTTGTGRVEEYAAIVAEHLDLAHDPDAAGWYLRAGRRALRVFALDEATHLLERAEQLVPIDDTRLLFDVVAAREDVLERQGDRTAQAAVAAPDGRAQRRPRRPRLHGHDPPRRESPGVRGQRVRRRRRPRHPGDRPRSRVRPRRPGGRGAPLVRQGADVARPGRGRSRAPSTPRCRSRGPRAGRRSWRSRCGTSPCWPATRAGSPTRWSFGARAREEFAKDGDLEAESTALAQHAVTLFNLGRLDESRVLFEQALPVFMASGHLYRQAVVLGNLASASFLMGDLAAAERWCHQAIERTDTLADVEAAATDRTVLGLIELWTHRWPTARANFESAWRTGHEVGATVVALDAATWLGIGMVEYGEPPKTSSSTRDPSPPTPTSRRSGPRTPATRCSRWATPWSPPATPAAGGGRRGREPGCGELLGDSGVDAGRPAVRRAATDDRPSRRPRPVDGGRRRRGRHGRGWTGRPSTSRCALRHVLAELWGALAGSSPDHEEARQKLRETVRAYVDRRLAGAEEPEDRAGFLAVPSVARLVQLLDAP